MCCVCLKVYFCWQMISFALRRLVLESHVVKLFSKSRQFTIWLLWVVDIGCILFQNLTNLDRSERNARVLNQNWSAATHLSKSDLATPTCAAGRRRSLFTCKRGRTLRRCADENQMTTPTMTRKICVFFFVGRSRVIDQDLSYFEKEPNHLLWNLSNRFVQIDDCSLFYMNGYQLIWICGHYVKYWLFVKICLECRYYTDNVVDLWCCYVT